ncbi:transmembrane domain [Cyclospora cayetanensis]|uniref:Transmembrane domain n=1 Tax=Cyclospora cayetanensis TaxID=88456 RepID=A0A1D3CZ51_9EIME|nr:transmembrane domain [Cyclospora cayetanensis]
MDGAESRGAASPAAEGSLPATASTGEGLADSVSIPLDEELAQDLGAPLAAAASTPVGTLLLSRTRALVLLYIQQLLFVGRQPDMWLSSECCLKGVMDTRSCFNHCSCTPVIVVSSLLFAVCCFSVVVTAILMGNLFSKGFVSSAFFYGGGYALLAASLFGLAVGSTCGGAVARCWPAALSFGGGTLAFACGIVLLGRRGAWLGAIGGVTTGGSIAGLVNPSAFPISCESLSKISVSLLCAVFAAVGCVMGLLLGIVIGFAPIFRDLKMNSRYIRHGLQKYV